ncbi:transient receptor potential channel pyrexia isoform X2 [Procambarus clarkii]|uniref:transient receptor potential channel pyrexia isoform X2 n=1 Tax=Procambarus clarkii TaxID=6728 RepID=UPI003743318D
MNKQGTDVESGQKPAQSTEESEECVGGEKNMGGRRTRGRMPPRIRVGGSESPIHDYSGLGVDPPRHHSRSCLDLSCSNTPCPPPSSVIAHPCGVEGKYDSRLKTPLVNVCNDASQQQQRSSRHVVSATQSAPQDGVITHAKKNSSSPVAGSPSRGSPRHVNGVTNTGICIKEHQAIGIKGHPAMGLKRHHGMGNIKGYQVMGTKEYQDMATNKGPKTTSVKQHSRVSNCLSWSPSSEKRLRQPIRQRVLSDGSGRRPATLSRSLRIKRWIKTKQHSSLQDKQDSFVTVDEADDDGRPKSHYLLDNIFEDGEVHIHDPEHRSRRRVSALMTKRRKQWRSQTQRDISPASDTTEDNIEKNTNLEDSLLDHLRWNSQASHEHRINALRSFLVTKNQPLVILNLLEANKISEAITMAKESKTRVRLDVCLLWACLHGAADLVQTLLEEGANVEARDNAGFSALHLAAESGSEEVLRVLLEGGARLGGPREWDGNEELTPLMLAARRGCVGGLEALLAAGANLNAGLNTSGETALHHAVRAASIDCIQFLINAGATVNPTLLYSETPLHIAVCEGLSDIVDILLSSGADVKASKGNSKMTSLHIAAHEGYCKVAHQLLKAGANPNQENLRRQTPLHLAAKAQSYDTVQLLLSFGANPNAHDCDLKTPLHSGIFKGSRSHECLRLLLEAGADTNAADQLGYTPLHMAALHDSSYCVLLFLDHGGDVTACTRGGISALHLILQRTPTVITHIHENLDAAISFSDYEQHERDSQVQIDFHILVPGDKDSLECRMLSCFIQEGQKPLLKHPLCETLLFLKWLRIRSFFIFNLVFYALLVAMLTCYIIIIFPAASCLRLNSTTQETTFTPFQFTASASPNEHHTSPTRKTAHLQQHNPHHDTVHSSHYTDGGLKQSENSITILPTLTLKLSEREKCGLKYEDLLAYPLYFIWIGTSILAVKEIFQVIDSPKTYFSSWDNVLVWPVIIFTMTITVTSYVREDTEDWEHHLAAVVILIGWVELLLLIGRFPVFGLYVQMFTHVTKNFGKFLFAYISLINAFSLSFGVLFPNHPPFRLYALRLVKTLVMMTGEIEYDTWFFNDDKTIMYPGTSHIIFVIFLIFVTIILMNLLVGLAVSDIQGLQKSAGLDRLVRQTELIAHFESFMFSKWFAWAMPKGILSFLHRSILLCPSLYGKTLVLSPKMLQDTGLPQELVEVILNTARARDRASRRRNAFANFRNLSKSAQYSSDADGDMQKSIDALRFGLDLLVWDVDARQENNVQIKEALATLSDEIVHVSKCVDTLVESRMCPNCQQQLEGKDERTSVYSSCDSLNIKIIQGSTTAL